MDKVNKRLYDRIAKLENKVSHQWYAIFCLVIICITSMSLNVSLASKGYADDMVTDNFMSTIDRSETLVEKDNEDSVTTKTFVKKDNVDLFAGTKIEKQFDLPIYNKSLERTSYKKWLEESKDSAKPVITKAVVEVPETKPEPKIISNEITEVKAVDTPVVEKDTDQFPETELTGNVNLDRDILTKVISEIAPDLSGVEDALLYNYNKYGIKPSFSLAVACLESGYGKSGLAKNKNNLYGMNAYPCNGLTAYQNAFTYSSKSESVIDFGDRMHSQYMLKGLTTLESINKVYCPPNSQWASLVRSIKNRIENIYNNYSAV